MCAWCGQHVGIRCCRYFENDERAFCKWCKKPSHGVDESDSGEDHHHPDQRELLRDNFDDMALTAADEIVRWATPVIHFRRTATEDTDINGFQVKQGEKVVMFYNSGNRDERVFENPYTFDVLRPPNPAQIGFGAGGPHFCLGANLARRELAVVFRDLFTRLPDIEVVGDAVPLDVAGIPLVTGVKHLNVRFTPTPRSDA